MKKLFVICFVAILGLCAATANAQNTGSVDKVCSVLKEMSTVFSEAKSVTDFQAATGKIESKLIDALGDGTQALTPTSRTKLTNAYMDAVRSMVDSTLKMQGMNPADPNVSGFVMQAVDQVRTKLIGATKDCKTVGEYVKAAESVMQ